MAREIIYQVDRHITPTDASYRGTPLEFTGFDNPTYRGLIHLAEKVYDGKMEVLVMGSTSPTEGPALLASNHPGISSVLSFPAAVREAFNRPVQMLAKEPLMYPPVLYPKAREDDSVAEKTGKNGAVLTGSPEIVDEIVNVLFCVPTRGANSIPIKRGKPSLESIRIVDKVFKAGGLVGVFPTGTRKNENDLSRMENGIGLLMSRNQDIEIYPSMIKNSSFRPKEESPVVVAFGEPFTYSDVIPNSKVIRDSRERERKVTLFLADRMADVWEAISPDVDVKLPKDAFPRGQDSETVVDFTQ